MRPSIYYIIIVLTTITDAKVRENGWMDLCWLLFPAKLGAERIEVLWHTDRLEP